METATADIDLLTCREMRLLGQHVPEILADLEAELGPEAVWTLTETCGGGPIYIAKRERPSGGGKGSSLPSDVADWLFTTVGPGQLVVPLGPSSDRARKIAAVRAGRRMGHSPQVMASDLGCHVRTVWRIAACLRDAGIN